MNDLRRLKEKLKKFRIECLLKGKERHQPSGYDYEVGWHSHDVYNPTINALLKAIEDLEEEEEEEEEEELKEKLKIATNALESFANTDCWTCTERDREWGIRNARQALEEINNEKRSE